MRTVRSVLGYGYFMVFLPFVFIVLNAAGSAQRCKGRGRGSGRTLARERAAGTGPRARETGRNPPLFSVFLNF